MRNISHALDQFSFTISPCYQDLPWEQGLILAQDEIRFVCHDAGKNNPMDVGMVVEETALGLKVVYIPSGEPSDIPRDWMKYCSMA